MAWLRPSRPKRYLVYTTDDLPTRTFDSIRIYLPPTPQNRRRAARVGKVGLAQIDAFTLDVLGGMGLLQRIKGVQKSKRAWQVTELGRSAVDHHKHNGAN